MSKVILVMDDPMRCIDCPLAKYKHRGGWLYERLKMYLDYNCVDLTYHKFEYEGNVYTQIELINKMIYGCELVFSQEFHRLRNLTDEEEKAIEDVRWIWATVMPAMWW